MSSDSPIFKSATELSQDLQAGTISSVEITQAMIDRIDAVDGQVHAFLHIDKEDALAQAKASDAACKRRIFKSFGWSTRGNEGCDCSEGPTPDRSQ